MSNTVDVSLTHDDLIRLGVTEDQLMGLREQAKAKENGSGFDVTKTHEITFSDECRCNMTDEALLSHVAINIRRGHPQVRPHAMHPNHAILVCGGPSLAQTEKELIEEVWRGGKVVTTNGAFQWCIDRNIRPSATIVLDAREFNSRFVEPEVLDCNYLLAAQCHPKAFDLCADRNVFIWHALTAAEAEGKVLEDYYWKQFWPVTVGTTVGIRAISLLRMLGFDRIHVFGLDSCWLPLPGPAAGSGEIFEHHAYPQPENNDEPMIRVWLRPEGRDDLAKQFYCSPWMMKQANDLQMLIRERGDMFKLNIHGPGLCAEILRTGAQMEPETTEGETDDTTRIQPPLLSEEPHERN